MRRLTYLRVEGVPLSKSLRNPLTWAVVAASIALAVTGSLLPALIVGLLVVPVNIDVEYELSDR